MRKFSLLRRRLKQAGVIACGLVLLVMAVTSLWFLDYAKAQPPAHAAAIIASRVVLMVGAVAVALVLLRDRHASDRTPYCPSCDYNLTGNVSGRCPECGHLIPDEDLTRSRRDPLFRNPFGVFQISVTGRSRSTKSLVVYVVYALVMILVIKGCFYVCHGLEKLAYGAD